jgi:hypothetical protein
MYMYMYSKESLAVYPDQSNVRIHAYTRVHTPTFTMKVSAHVHTYTLTKIYIHPCFYRVHTHTCTIDIKLTTLGRRDEYTHTHTQKYTYTVCIFTHTCMHNWYQTDHIGDGYGGGDEHRGRVLEHTVVDLSPNSIQINACYWNSSMTRSIHAEVAIYFSWIWCIHAGVSADENVRAICSYACMHVWMQKYALPSDTCNILACMHVCMYVGISVLWICTHACASHCSPYTCTWISPKHTYIHTPETL